MGHIYINKVFIFYLKIKFNWAASILSGNTNTPNIGWQLSILDDNQLSL